MKPINILHIEDDEEDVALVKLILNKAGISFTQTVISNKQSLLQALQENLPDIILSDHSLPAFNSLEALKLVRQKSIHLPFILVTGNTSEEFAVSLIKAGADDYILKDRMERLPSALWKALEKVELTFSKIKLQEEAAQKIRVSEAKYRSFFESSMDGMLLTITDGQILAANPAACALFQMTEEEICAAGRLALVDLSDPNVMKLIEERRRTGRAQGEVTFIRKDGKKFMAEITSAIIKDAFGQERTSMIFRDITERKKTEQRLIDTSKILRQTLDVHEKIMKSSLDVICSIDEEGKFVNVSAACEEIWGYTSLELYGKPYLNLVVEEDVEITMKSARSIMNGIVATNFENRYIHKDGSIVPMLWSGRWDENDKLMYCIAKDITDKKRLEKAFTIERQRFLDLYLQAPSCMGILKGSDYVYEMANPLYLQLIDKKDIIGKTVKEVLPELADQGIFELLDSVYQTGKTFFANEMLIKFDFYGTGELVDRYLNFIYQAHRNGEGQIDGIFFFVIDVTEQVLSRHKIEVSERKFRQIVETAQEGIWMIDEHNKTTFVNKRMCEILEYEEEEMLGKTNLFFKEEDEQEVALQQIERRKKGISETEESRFVTKSGRKICTQLSTNAIIDKDGTYKGALAMVNDITEKKELELQLFNEQINRQKQITRAALEAQENERNYLGGELHDNINQILAAVTLQLTFCYENFGSEKQMLNNAKQNVELAMSEIRNLSHKLVTHRFGEELLVPMINNLILQLFAPGMVKMDFSKFDENIATEIKLTLYRIIQEHLNNIIKHAMAQHIYISICSNDIATCVLMEDDGVGFNLNQYRNGVGITNIYNRVESYNGTVAINTEPGKGCKLKVVLPIC
ncbi:hybrid sensor histidine kinase/response regulator [Flavisolibacter ginsengisoli]|jgi:PAS domain S-box-containing protein|uniref:histidine kinase n=1 Tax=Flavisolibacter ginsengisoli DSM 18119 TaxID=1121884 RepID=A0A1M4X5H6_9BACT|nr:PAS domain S-box protein [Flavisolibacter ginsengisoli]SHE88695.1 PAS domain S-box-containing protein [Flavisolibacter ginsengisoli DSM 18119]